MTTVLTLMKVGPDLRTEGVWFVPILKWLVVLLAKQAFCLLYFLVTGFVAVLDYARLNRLVAV